MAEQPSLNGRPPERVSRHVVRRRRLVALVAAVAALVALVAASFTLVPRHGHTKTAPPPPPPKPFKIVFPEGFTRAQMAQRVGVVAKIAAGEHRGTVHLSAGAYLAASRRAWIPCLHRAQTNLEGYLFPATYEFVAATTSRQLVAQQIHAFCKYWPTVGMRYARSKNLTVHDVVTIASMIEREVAVAAERPLIAAVIYNRLHARMPLGIDATLRYGLHIAPTQSILKSQLQNPTPYNTRLHQGLPPTPIANPGLAALRAAAHPAKVSYLFYVRKPGRRDDYFTSSSADFYRYLCRHGYGC